MRISDLRSDVCSSDLLASGSFHQRRTAKEDRALFAHDDAFIAHRRHVGTAGRTRTHHHRDLRDIERAHPRLVVENPPEVLAVGKHLVLQRQERARSEEHTSELQSLMRNSYAVFCLKKKKTKAKN